MKSASEMKEYKEKLALLDFGFNDLNGDGIADTLLFRWNGKTTIFISDNGELPWSAPKTDWNAFFNKAFNTDKPTQLWNEMRAGWGSYTLLIDRNGDGCFDGSEDFFYHALDLNGDGYPEATFHHLTGYPGFKGNDPPWSNKLHVVLDGDKDISYIDFKDFIYREEQEYDSDGRYYMNVHGSGFFLNSYSTAPMDSWENPIAWYDFDGDGRTNMVMRVADNNLENGLYRGDANEFEVAFELNNNTREGKYHSLDFQLTYYTLARKGMDYSDFVDNIPQLALFPGSEYISGDRAQTRGQTKRRYFPYLDGYRLGTDYPDWEGCFMIFDEDDDSNRWEELFSTHETKQNAADDFYLCADQIGDRIERDIDFGGGGQIYVGCFDNRLHLYHAEEAYWDIDYFGVWQGAIDHPFESEGPKPPKGLRYNKVKYYDNDRDGYIDYIEYGVARYGYSEDAWTIERSVDLLQCCAIEDIQTARISPQVESPATGWRLETWDGTPFTPHTFEGTAPKDAFDKYVAVYDASANKMWEDAQKLYDCAKSLGLNKSEHMDVCCETVLEWGMAANMTDATVPKGYTRHLTASNRREKYHNGYWLREKVYEDILGEDEPDKNILNKFYYGGKIDCLCAYLYSKYEL